MLKDWSCPQPGHTGFSLKGQERTENGRLAFGNIKDVGVELKITVKNENNVLSENKKLIYGGSPMKKSFMLGAVCVSYFLLTFSTSSNADMVNGSILSIDSGSHFELDSTGIAPILGNDGLIVGTSQFASGSHSGIPDGTENPGIDNPWGWLGNTGMHLTTSPTDILNDDGAGNVLLDFSGWEWTWNLQTWNLGSGAWNGNPDGVALMSCANNCGDGDTYTLTYSATFPNSPDGLGGVQYRLSLNGVISSVPVPAAVWLFGSGLLGLVGMARRNKAE